MAAFTHRLSLGIIAVLFIGPAVLAAPPSAALKAKLDAKIKESRWMSTDAKVVAAVKEHNAHPPAEFAGMTQEKWKSLSVLDPLVRGLDKNPLAEYLKTRRDPAVSELFVSGADGTKVAFFGKTTNWSHKGMPKHEVPMEGKVFIGPVQLDESAGVEEVQVGLPVLDGTKPIGSIVIGFDTTKLK